MIRTPRADAIPSVLFTLLFMMAATANKASGQPDLEGYVADGDTVIFYFSERAYNLHPNRVVVTGQFRGWSQDLDPEWDLERDDVAGVWRLTIANSNFDTIPPDSEFKFRVNDGDWLSPPASAPNTRNGNLVYLPGMTPPRLRAEVRSPHAVWATLSGVNENERDNADFHLEDAHGNQLSIEAIVPNSATEFLVVPARDLDVRRVHYLSYDRPNGAKALRALVRRDPWFRTLYSAKQLGANVAVDSSTTTFRIFAPRADRIRLFLYEDPNRTTTVAEHELTPDADGVWEVVVPGNLEGTYYDYAVYGPSDPGDSFFEERGVKVTDPYARASVDSFGPSRVMRPTVPATPLAGGRPPMRDLAAYEVHVQDFTDALPISDSLRGTFAGMQLAGLTNAAGEPVGFDYLTDLGINAVHLMPVQEYLHYPEAEWRDAFYDDPYMQSQDIARENYQWGYRTTHAFAIESRYRKRGSDFGDEREQFRDLVQAFHDRGLAVLIDLVPNHTGENMDGREYVFTFNGIDRPYYYRTDEALQHIGPFGNEVKSEDRPMVQRWIIDQCVDLISEFGIDGFRIDLAGQIDEQTLKALRRAVGEDVLIYGEPWIAPSDPDVVANPDWSWYKVDAPITYFQDAARDAFKGSPSNPQHKKTDRGFAGGNVSQRVNTMLALTNAFEDERDPARGINYLDIHDNWALADRFARTDWNGLLGVDEGPYRLAATLLMTSLGPIVLHGGSEIMRSKGSAPLEEVTRYTASGPLAFHGKRDTYNLRVANRFLWETVGSTPDENAAGIDYAGMHHFWKELLALRMSSTGSVFRLEGTVPIDHYRWILPDDPSLLGYLVGEKVLVLLNTGDADASFNVGPAIPAGGTWKLVVDGSTANLNGIGEQQSSAELGAIVVSPASSRIWVRTDTTD